MKLANLKVQTRLSIGFAILIAGLIAVGGLGAFATKSLDSAIYQITAVNSEQRRLALDMRSEVLELSIVARNIILLTDPADLAAESERAEKSAVRYREAREALGKLFNADPGTSQEEFRLYNAAVAGQQGTTEIFKRVTDLGRAGNNEEATRILISELRPKQTAWLNSLTELADHELKLNDEEASEARALSNGLLLTLITVAGLVALMGILSAYMIARSILKQLGGEPGDAQRLAGEIAAGDLTTRLTVDPRLQDSLMHSLEAMRSRLAGMVSSIKQSAESISTAAGQISQGNTDLSQRTEEQAASLEETAASMEELTSTVRQNEENAVSGNHLAAGCADTAREAGSVVAEVVTTMGEISSNSKRVGEIVAVIDTIAFQTNILALNAAVEAARAGEQGRGFAVVASEVRALAQRSATSAKEIKDLIEKSASVIRNGEQFVERAGTGMSRVVESVAQMTSITGEIAAASKEQTSGIEQVNTAISQMDSVTQQNAALVEESAAAAHSMAQQARQLLDVVSVFKTAEYSSGSPTPRSPQLPRPMALLEH